MAKKPDSVPSKKRGPKRSPRRQAAEEAGMSRAQMWRAMQIANLPEDEFEALVESDDPPTVSRLVEIGQGQAKRARPPRLSVCPCCGEDLTKYGIER